MYEIIKNPVMMEFEEIKQQYDNKWVYLTNMEFNTRHGLVRGIPVIVADDDFLGVDEGIYDKYDKPEYGKTYGCNFLPYYGPVRVLSINGVPC